MSIVSWHNHTDGSNHTNRDSIIKINSLIDTALELNHTGVGITDHAVMSMHVKAINYLKELRKKATGEQKEKLDNFKLGLGCEIYLVNKDEVDFARENKVPTKFYHLVMLAKNKKGYRQLSKISSMGWENSFHYRGMIRVPVYKEDMKDIIGEKKGNLIVTSACLGSEFSQLCISYLNNPITENQNKIHEYLLYMNELFGEDYYIEIQPSNMEEQIRYNKFAIDVARYYGIKVIISTDSHYQRPNVKRTHTEFLRSQNAERETEDFYSSTYLMSLEETREYFDYILEEDFNMIVNNTVEIANKIEEFDLYEPTKVPDATIELDSFRPFKFATLQNLSVQYPYIHKYLTSEYTIDRIILQQIEIGMEKNNQAYNDKNLSRINLELESMWEVSAGLGERLSSYYVLTKEIVDLIFTISLVGVSRGSAGSFYISYLLRITSINPIDYDLDSWRHLEKSKIELADIDIDSESAQRGNILELVKEKYGHRKVLNIATFKREGTASSIQTIARGMEIPLDDAKYLTSLIPREGITMKSISYCLENYDNDSKCKFFVDELYKVDEDFNGFVENLTRIEGLICGTSSHASGIYIFKDDYTEVNALMKTTSGLEITQFDMLDSDLQSGLKIDFLTISTLDRLRKCMDLLLKDGLMEWQGDLRSTYNKYLHPDVLDLENPEMFKMLREGKVLDAFQYESVAGAETIAKIQPDSFQELMDGNALMRLNPKDVELPILTYVRHKEDISFWYQDMIDAGLTVEEMEVLKRHLSKSYGVAPTQESIMKLSMDSAISGFNLIQANKLRKAVAKAYARHMADEVHQMMLQEGLKLGNREVFINYVWERFIVPQLKLNVA